MNLRILANPANQKFFSVLESAPNVLTREQAPDFFKVALKLFDRRIGESTGKLVLQTIRKVIENPHHMKEFTAGNFALRLPFTQTQFCDGIFDIVHVLVDAAPRTITSQLVDLMDPCIETDPAKCLVLIAKYSVHFPEVDNPWPFLDLLFKEAQLFTAPNTIRNYCTVLCYLCNKFEEYRNGRFGHCWAQINACLASTDTETICSSYDALCFLHNLDEDGDSEIDFDAIYRHLQSPETCQHALSLLISIEIPESEQTSSKLVKSLLEAAKYTEKATLVLMGLLQSEEVATRFARRTSWLLTKIPKVIDTLRVFLVVFRHKELRHYFGDSADLVPFLKSLLEQANMGMVSIVGTIIRRLPLIDDQIVWMSEQGLFRLFFNVAWKLDDDISMDAAFMLANHISKICYIPELESFADKVADCAMSDERLAKTACFVAAELARHEPCYQKMAADGLRDFFEDNLDDPKISRIAARFLQHKRPTVKKPRRLRPT